MLNRAIDRLIERQKWLEPWGDTLQKVAHSLGMKGGSALKTLLSGTWLGHPLHPVLTDIPIGAWTLAVLFDLIYIFGHHGVTSRVGANVAIVVGIVAALATALTGYNDWAETFDRERRVGLAHGLLNFTAVILYVIAIIIRLAAGTGAVGIIISWIGYLLVISAAYLGGELVFNIGTGVNHHAWQEPVTDWIPVLKLSALPDGKMTLAEVKGTPILLLRRGQGVCAIGNTCAHAGGPLNEGELKGNVVICPWHQSHFDVCSGRVLAGPATMSQVRYEARVIGDTVELRRHPDTLQPN